MTDRDAATTERHRTDRFGDSTIAVTGAAGYIGSRVVAALRSRHPEWEIVAIDNFYAGTIREIDGVAVEHVDVRNRERLWNALDGADVVLHLAAISGVDDCAERPQLAYEVNVTGTGHVAMFCHRRSIPLAFPASMAILGDPDPDSFPITVDQEREPLNWYGRTKLLGERLLESFAEGSFPAHMFLKSNLYGSHWIDDRRVSKGTVINFFVERASNGDPLTVYEPGSQARNFVHVADVARAYVRSAEVLLERRAGDETGVETYAIASDEDPSVGEIAELVREIGRDVAGLEPAVELVENPRSAETLVDDFPVDTTRTHDELGWAPTRTVEDSIRRLVRERTTDDAEPDRRSTGVSS